MCLGEEAQSMKVLQGGEIHMGGPGVVGWPPPWPSSSYPIEFNLKSVPQGAKLVIDLNNVGGPDNYPVLLNGVKIGTLPFMTTSEWESGKVISTTLAGLLRAGTNILTITGDTRPIPPGVDDFMFRNVSLYLYYNNIRTAEGSTKSDPITIVSGNVYTTSQDLFIPSKGLDLDFMRTYNSNDEFSGVLGWCWTHSYNMRLIDFDVGVEFVDKEGGRHPFIENDDESYATPRGKYWKLVKNPDDTYTLTEKHGTKYNFDENGKLVSIVDRNSNAQTLTYTGDLLTQITDSVGRSVAISYNGDNRISTVTDPAGRTLTYNYDAEGNLISFTDQAGNITTYTYDNHNLTRITNPEGDSTHFTYDAEGNMGTSVSYDNDIGRESLTYERNNFRTILSNSKDKTSVYEYNSDGAITRITDSEGNERSWTWDENINRTSATGANGNTTLFEYDEKGNLTKITDPKGSETAFTYESDFDMCASITDTLSQATNYTYDERGNLIQVENAKGDVTNYTYDSSGNLLSTTDANEHTTQYEYDSYGNLIKVIDPLNNQTQFEYDILGNCKKLMDAKGNETQYIYDILNRLTQITYPDNSTVKYAYDKVGNRTSVTDPLNRITNYSYDPANKLLEVIDALQNKTIYAYDTEGNRTSVEDANGNATTYEYDSLNRLIKVITSSGKETNYSYDAAGNRISTTDAKGNTTVYEYDKNNRLVKTGILEDIQNVRTWDTQADFESGIGENIDTGTNPGSVILSPEHSITFHGDAQLDTAQKEFGTSSLLCDGTGDKLTIAGHSNFEFGTGDWTIDFWLRFNSVASAVLYDADPALGMYLQWYSNKIYVGIVGDFYAFAWTPSANTWYHFAAIRNGNDLKVLIDGAQIGVTKDITGKNITGMIDPISIGGWENASSECLNGHIDEFRISKGIARWTSDFTPSNSEYSTDSYTKLLLHLNGEDGATSTEDSSIKYSPSGSLTLNHDTGNAETFGRLDITAAEPEGTEIKARIKVTNTLEDLEGTSWSGWYYSFPASFVKTGRYARVEISLATQDPSVTPVLDSISLNKVDLSSVVNFTYDELGRRTSMTDTIGTTAYAYDNLNRLTSVIASGGKAISYTYDAVGNRISMTDQSGGVTQYTYDELNRLVSLTAPDGKVTNYSYDAVSNLVNMNLPNNTQVNYHFDNLNRLLNLTNKKNIGDKISSFNYSYNLSGMRNKVILADGSYIEYEYDGLNRLTKEAKYDAQGNVVYSNTYEFDPIGNRLKLTKLVPGNLEEKSFEDDFNRKQLGENWQVVDGKWRITGRRWLFGWARNKGEIFYNSEDSIGNFEAEVDFERLYCEYKKRYQVSGISYQGAKGRRVAGVKGELKRYLEKKKVKRTIIIWKYKKVKFWRWYRWVRYPVKNTYWRWVYHWRIEREVSYVLGHYEGSALVEDAVFIEKTKSPVFSKRIKVGVEEDGKSELFARENGNWIKKVEFAYASTEKGKVGLFVYGKRVAYSRFDNFKLSYEVGTAPQEEIINYDYNEENQLLTVDNGQGQALSLQYDDNGNLIRKDDVQGATDYSWDYENRLTGIIYPDGTSDGYTYDGVGKRIQTNEDGKITNYLYDGLNVIIEQDNSGMTTANYVRGLGYGGGIGSIISKQLSEGSKQYYYYDGIGNVINMADNASNVTQTYVYDAYGNVLNGEVPSPHGFSTKEYSLRSGLIHFGARLYNPTVGRFISKDPLGMINGPNVYAYVNNNPINLIDPWGLCQKGGAPRWSWPSDVWRGNYGGRNMVGYYRSNGQSGMRPQDIGPQAGGQMPWDWEDEGYLGHDRNMAVAVTRQAVRQANSRLQVDLFVAPFRSPLPYHIRRANPLYSFITIPVFSVAHPFSRIEAEPGNSEERDPGRVLFILFEIPF